VDVHFRVKGHIEIYHRAQVFDIEAARRDIGSYKYIAAAVGEKCQHFGAVFLLQVSVNAQGVEFVFDKVGLKVPALLLGVAENKG
jgi:hypothetical protein